MFSGQTIIGRVVARCPARTEPLAARVRLARLLGGTDLLPPGMPPQAVLVVRRVAARERVPLGAPRLGPEWERAAREEIARLWRRAARPARGRVPADAEAVWFDDVSEWLAALGLAVREREVERHWCWQAARASGVHASTSTALVRAWIESPRFVPAALVRLAHWGEAARVLGLLQPAEATTLLVSLAREFDLPHDAAAPTRARAFDTPRDAAPRHQAATTTRADADTAPSANDKDDDARDELRTTSGTRASFIQPAPAPPWSRWLASTGAACEQLHAPAQRLLSFAAALFHAPARARTQDFAAEVATYLERTHTTRPARDTSAPTQQHTPRRTRQRDGDDATTPRRDARTRDLHEQPLTTSDATDTTRRTQATTTHDAHARDDKRHDEASAPPSSMRPTTPGDARDKEPPVSVAFIDEHDEGDAEETTLPAPWRDVEGHETRLGGVLFLLNFFVHLRLPECFDEDLRLSEHVTGWGLAEAFARALLAELGGDARAYEQDPLWGVLARLDGRVEGTRPAHDLQVGDDYRAPARWLKLFLPDDAAAGMSFRLSGPRLERLELRHAGGFPVAVQTLAGESPSSVAARLVEDYRAQGVALEELCEAVVDEGSVDEGVVDERQSGFGKWLSWTLPLMKYVLARALAEVDEVLTGEELARVLLLKRGRLYATATHVDLVLAMTEVSLPVRRAGFDASPGWVRDLMRVVAFHYE